VGLPNSYPDDDQEYDLVLTWPNWSMLQQKGRLVKFRADEIIYHKGFPAEGVFLLCKGSVKLTAINEAGASRIAEIVTGGRLFGLDSLGARPFRFSTAVTREVCEAVFLATGDFRRLVQSSPDFLWSITLMLNEMLHCAYHHHLSISGLRVRDRIESVLLDLSQRLSQSAAAKQPGFAKLKQREIAELLGVPEETVCREMRTLKSGTLPKQVRFILESGRRNK